MGGNVLYEIAKVTDVHFVLPVTISVPPHWAMLRKQGQQALVARIE